MHWGLWTHWVLLHNLQAEKSKNKWIQNIDKTSGWHDTPTPGLPWGLTESHRVGIPIFKQVRAERFPSKKATGALTFTTSQKFA